MSGWSDFSATAAATFFIQWVWATGMVTRFFTIKSGPITIFIPSSLAPSSWPGATHNDHHHSHHQQCTTGTTITTTITIITIFNNIRRNAQLAPRALLNKRRGGVGRRVWPGLPTTTGLFLGWGGWCVDVGRPTNHNKYWSFSWLAWWCVNVEIYVGIHTWPTNHNRSCFWLGGWWCDTYNMLRDILRHPLPTWLPGLPTTTCLGLIRRMMWCVCWDTPQRLPTTTGPAFFLGWWVYDEIHTRPTSHNRSCTF